jgi:hypothetical protein
MGFFKELGNIILGVFRAFASIFTGPGFQQLVRDIIRDIVKKEFGIVTPQNRDDVFRAAIKRLEEKKGSKKVHQNWRLIASVIDGEIDFAIAKQDNNRRDRGAA